MKFGNENYFARPTGVRHDFYINEIGDADDFNELLYCLDVATALDEVHLHINSYGGSFVTACQIAHSMFNTNAGRLVCHGEGMVASAATLLFLAGREWVVGPLSEYMFHTSSGAEIGRAPDNLKSALAHKEHLNRVAQYCYKDFFDEDEVKGIIEHGNDVWMTPEEVQERIELVLESVKDQEKLIDEQLELLNQALGDSSVSLKTL